MSEFKERIKSAINAALRGDSLREYQQDLIKLAALGIAIEKDQNYQDYLGECSKIFNRVGEVDLSEWAKELSAKSLMEHIGKFVLKLLYLEPAVEGFPGLSMLPRASLGDNRLILLTGFLVAYPENPYEKVLEIAVSVAGKRTCGIELQKRIIGLKGHVRRLLNLIYFEEREKNTDLAELVDEIRPKDWRTLASLLELSTDDMQQEIDSLLRFSLGVEIVKQGKRSIPEVMMDALEQRFDYLPKRLRDRIIDEVREAKSKKRTPTGGIESLDATEERAEQPPLSELDRSKIEDALRRSKSELKKAYGPKALEFIRSAMLTTGPRPIQEEMAKELGISSRQVRKYISKMKKDPNPLFRFLSGLEEQLN